MRRILCVSAFALMLAPVLAIAADFPLTKDNTTITFIGAKPKGKHEGGFKSVTGTASVDKDDLTTLKLSIDIDMDSVYSDNAMLTGHLKTADFFGVKSNPKSKFVSKKVEKAAEGYKITGDLTMLGKTKEISFPAKLAVGADGLTLSSSFTIDRTQWGMNYKKADIDTDVKLTVSVKAK
jgi:polyisoprenoid-binding protein YceI